MIQKLSTQSGFKGTITGESTVSTIVPNILPVSITYIPNTWEMEQEDTGKWSLA